MTKGPRQLGRLSRNALILAAFALLVALMTWPQVARLGDGTRDWGDPLLNAWIMWWEVDAFSSGNFDGFFDANIFFPHRRSLAYSEFLVPQTLFAAPFLLATDNPVLAYNVALLLSFLATAFAMYLLGKHLTGSAFAGFVAGCAMAFSPFMFSHLSHVQVIGAAGFPLAFLFLHRYFDNGSLAALLCFTVAYIVQALANGYYAVYLTYAAGAYIVYRMVTDRRLTDASLRRHLALHGALSLVALAPFYGQYLLMRHEIGFARHMAFTADPTSFLAAPSINRLYGALTAPLSGNETNLFTGVSVMILAFIGLLACRRSASGVEPEGTGAADEPPATTETAPPSAVWRLAYRTLGIVVVVALIVIALITVTGGINSEIGGVRLRANDLDNPLLALAGALVLRACLRGFHPAVDPGRPWLRRPARFYAGLLVASVLLNLGAEGPYGLLYDYAPGFDALRAVPRIHILTVFCLAVFVAYGSRDVAARLADRGLAPISALMPLLVLTELFSAPLPMHDVKWGDDVPEVYRWLARQEGNFAAIELPLEHRLEFDRMLYSTLHGKLLVNGASGHVAPIYGELERRQHAFPLRDLFADVRALGVRWVIIHRDRYGAEWPEIGAYMPSYVDLLTPLTVIDDALVLEVRDGPWLGRDEVYARSEQYVRDSAPAAMGERLSTDGWTVTANVYENRAPLAVDGDLSTRWHTRLQQPGDHFEVDMGHPARFDRVVTRLFGFPHDYPRGWRLAVSDDRQRWRVVAEESVVRPPIIGFLQPRGMPVSMTFPQVEARYLRIEQTGSDDEYEWSINELEVYRSGEQR